MSEKNELPPGAEKADTKTAPQRCSSSPSALSNSGKFTEIESTARAATTDTLSSLDRIDASIAKILDPLDLEGTSTALRLVDRSGTLAAEALTSRHLPPDISAASAALKAFDMNSGMATASAALKAFDMGSSLLTTSAALRALDMSSSMSAAAAALRPLDLNSGISAASAALRSLDLNSGISAASAALRSLDLNSGISAAAAALKSLDLSSGMSAAVAALRSLDLNSGMLAATAALRSLDLNPRISSAAAAALAFEKWGLNEAPTVDAVLDELATRSAEPAKQPAKESQLLFESGETQSSLGLGDEYQGKVVSSTTPKNSLTEIPTWALLVWLYILIPMASVIVNWEDLRQGLVDLNARFPQTESFAEVRNFIRTELAGKPGDIRLVKGSDVRLRLEPSMKSEVILLLPSDAPVIVLDKENRTWLFVSYEHQGYIVDGYVSTKFLKKVRR
ncbi:TPA: SH3 domain-containing protein [Pseudomonas aeruginosa]|uniref:SH3 domain-containing protein n=3 Tax=Pseudomonas aeruginosa TaxID=287 RepID=UPI000AE47469|nr:SH3 domain-containing protein [Pseudomonas aeruginosa]MBG5154847.1 SH3 domain-containing protein [Pseudomonas aeruginosa]MCO2915898.1 SH3 domain-containing protein [Pseudomonas aeruginosa]MCS7887681.1 SH3 domain-containing protein [Pseudomonas aeruginosa]QKZ58890.1 SH3 domain-containing protein [Pseudomonas aeruginosa]UKW00466.1 SH3 domain-containing protein [Pseudomonas aeruginosa]